MTKKLIALAVCTAMLISLAGCGDKDKKTKKTKAKADSSSIVDDSSISDSSASDSSVPDVTTVTTTVETSQTTKTPAQTTKTPAQTTKPVTTVKTATVSAGCYQAELANIKGWDNKYRPAGKYAYVKYGTQSAQQYYEVVKAAYDFAHNTTLVNKYKQGVINTINNYFDGDINKYLGCTNRLIPNFDYDFVMLMASSDYLITTYTIKDSNQDHVFQLGNAYSIIKNKTGTYAEFFQLMIAFANQCNAKALFCKVIDKSGKETCWMKITDSKGQVWYMDENIYTKAELLAAGYKITVEDYMG